MPDSSSHRFHVASLHTLSAEQGSAVEASPFGPFVVRLCETAEEVEACLSADTHCHALVIAARDDIGEVARTIAADVAVLAVSPDLEPETVLGWLQQGVQDVLTIDELADASFPRRLRSAIERKRIEREARMAYSTDLDTGLPHQQQLIEHMSQLLALREREPAPMAVLVLRVEGLATAQARLGRDASNVLRRKVGVRLRAGVRASDVVASLGDDSFAVLLGSILTPADADRVGAKLLAALMEPMRVAGHEVAVATALGIGQYPQDGSQPEALLRRAVAFAAAAPAQGRAGFANFVESAPPSAANDE